MQHKLQYLNQSIRRTSEYLKLGSTQERITNLHYTKKYNRPSTILFSQHMTQNERMAGDTSPATYCRTNATHTMYRVHTVLGWSANS